MGFVNSMLELVGNTPLLKLNKVGKDVPANVFVKLEYLNPSGSYKDRMALSMIEAAEAGLTWNGKKLEPGGTVCDCSAGTTAPALAFVCAVKGYAARLSAYTPLLGGDSTRLKSTKAYGADVTGSPPASDYMSEEQLNKVPEEDKKDLAWVIAAKREMADLERNSTNTVWVDQIYNPYNKIGQMSMGYEIYEQLDGRIIARYFSRLRVWPLAAGGRGCSHTPCIRAAAVAKFCSDGFHGPGGYTSHLAPCPQSPWESSH